MAIVSFSSFIQHFVRCRSMEVRGDTVHKALENYFEEFWQVQRFILDDEGRVRPRLTVFLDGLPVLDLIGRSDPVHVSAKILVQ